MISPERMRAIAKALGALTYRELEVFAIGIGVEAGLKPGHAIDMLTKGIADWADKTAEEKNDEQA